MSLNETLHASVLGMESDPKHRDAKDEVGVPYLKYKKEIAIRLMLIKTPSLVKVTRIGFREEKDQPHR